MHNHIVTPVATGCRGGQQHKWVQKAIRKFLKEKSIKGSYTAEMKIQPWLRKALKSRLPETGRMKWRKYHCTCPALVLFCWASAMGWSETGYGRGDPSVWLSAAVPAAWLFSSRANPHGGCWEAVFLHVLLSCVTQVIQERTVTAHWDQIKKGLSFWTQWPELRNLLLWGQES